MVALNRWTCWGTTPSIAPDVVGRGSSRIVATADPDLARRVVPEPEQQVDEGRLAGAARADEREAAAGRDGEAPARRGRAARPARSGSAGRGSRCRAGCGVGAGRGAAGTRRARRTARRRIDQLEQPAARRPRWRRWSCERLRQRRDRLEARDGGQRQRGPGRRRRAGPPATSRIPMRQDGDRGQARRTVPPAADGRAADQRPADPPARSSSAPEREDARRDGGRPVERDEVGDALDLVDEHRAQLGAGRDERHRRPRATAGAQTSGRTTPVSTRNADAARAQERIEDAQQESRERGHEGGHDRRHDDPDVEVLERLDVGDDPGQQVAAAVVGQAGRRQRLDRGEEPDPQVGQDREASRDG